MKNFLRFVMFAVVLGTVHLPHAVMADGKPLPAGTYQVRLVDQVVTPAAGQSQDAERWVEFVKGDTVVGRELASVVSAADMATMAKGKRPAANASLVQSIKGGDGYLRVWINKNKVNYLIHLGGAK